MKREILDKLFTNNYPKIYKQFVGINGKHTITANGQTKEDILHNYIQSLLENCADIKIDKSINTLLNSDIEPDKETINTFNSKVLYTLNKKFLDANTASVLRQKMLYSIDIDTVPEDQTEDLRLLIESRLDILTDEEHMYVTYFNRYKKGEASIKLGIDRKTFRKRMGLIIGKIRLHLIATEQIIMT